MLFTFLCKQNQENRVAQLLRDNLHCQVTTKEYAGRRGSGVMVLCELPPNTSKRNVDKMLHFWGVPGSVARKKKLKVLNLDKSPSWTLKDKLFNFNKSFDFVEFRAFYKGKFWRGVAEYRTFCECCGPELRVFLTRGKHFIQLY